jgi:uncharacterized protein (TIGR00251 family)
VITETPEGVILDIKVIPRAGKTMLAGTRDNALLIRLAAAPVDGAANATLIAFLAAVLHIPARDLTLISGERSRSKRMKISGLDAAAVRARIGAAGAK